jgi:hypothetical protein
MSKNVKVHLSQGYQIRERSVFNLDKLYKELYGWLSANEYDFDEVLHQQKKLEGGDELIISWEAEREVTDFIKYKIKVDFMLMEINPVSENLVSGFAKITFTANLVLDYKEKWSSSKPKDFLFSLYTNVFFKETISKHKKKLTQEISDFHSAAKDILEFYR